MCARILKCVYIEMCVCIYRLCIFIHLSYYGHMYNTYLHDDVYIFYFILNRNNSYLTW